MAPRLANFLVLAILLVGVLDALTGGGGNAVAPPPSVDTPPPGMIPAGGAPAGFFKICKGQTHALCATASCTVLNKVAYCKCDVKEGESIS